MAPLCAVDHFAFPSGHTCGQPGLMSLCQPVGGAGGQSSVAAQRGSNEMAGRQEDIPGEQWEAAGERGGEGLCASDGTQIAQSLQKGGCCWLGVRSSNLCL